MDMNSMNNGGNMSMTNTMTMGNMNSTNGTSATSTYLQKLMMEMMNPPLPAIYQNRIAILFITITFCASIYYFFKAYHEAVVRVANSSNVELKQTDFSF